MPILILAFHVTRCVPFASPSPSLSLSAFFSKMWGYMDGDSGPPPPQLCHARIWFCEMSFPELTAPSCCEHSLPTDRCYLWPWHPLLQDWGCGRCTEVDWGEAGTFFCSVMQNRSGLGRSQHQGSGLHCKSHLVSVRSE